LKGSLVMTMDDSCSLPVQSVTEDILLDQARSGHEQAFAQLVAMHSEKIIALAWRLVGQREIAEEIAQEAFLRLYRSLPGFRGESRIGTWLYRTVSRLAIDHLRREKLRRKFFFSRSENSEQPDPLDLVADDRASPQEQLLAREAGRRMQQVLEKLPARQKTVFVLRHMEGMPIREIAATLELKEGTVKAHLHRAVTQFRKEFGETAEANYETE